jgi:hypothetical protein
MLACHYAMESEERYGSEIMLHVNHADGDTLNAYAYNLEWTTAQENRAQLELRRLVPEYDSRGRRNAHPYTANGHDAVRLRAGIYMSAQREPAAFGDFCNNGANGAYHAGEPYAKFISRAIATANLPADAAFIRVTDKDGNERRIAVGGRTIWQIIGDCWAARAVEITGHTSGFIGSDSLYHVPEGCAEWAEPSLAPDVQTYLMLNRETCLPSGLQEQMRDLLKAGHSIRIVLDSGITLELAPKRDIPGSVLSSAAGFIRIDAKRSGSWRVLYNVVSPVRRRRSA